MGVGYSEYGELGHGYYDPPTECEFKQGEERICYDCMRDKDSCPDCYRETEDSLPSLYLSPDSYTED